MRDTGTRYLRNTWYVALWSQDLAPGKLVTRTLLDEPIVFYRREDGAPVALFDRCAHRFAPLSLGKLRPDDRVECPYHGLQYDEHGICVVNPHGNRKIPPAARTRAYPVVERHSAIWIWMGEQTPDPTAIPDFSILDPEAENPVSKRDYLLMQAAWDLIADNLLDLSHTAFLHDGLLGNAETVDGETTVEQKGNQVWVRRWYPGIHPPGFHDLIFRQDGKPIDSYQLMRWDPPALMINETAVLPVGGTRDQGTGIFGVHFLTPETATTTHYLFAAARWNVIPRSEEDNAELLRQIAELRRVAFEDQDQVVIAAQQQRMRQTSEPLRPALLSIDAGVVRAHKILESLMDRERAGALVAP